MSSIRVDLVGDVQINRERPETALAKLTPEMEGADLRICQLEATMSELGEVRSDVQNPAHRVPPRMVKGLVAADIDAVTFAGNNNVDYGPDAMFDTISLLNDNGIEVVGVGADIEDAREPLYLSTDKGTVGVVNACSILRSGYAATDTRAGLSPLHVSTFYETLENQYEQPATPARTVSIPDWHDLAAFTDRIAEAKRQADHVLACIHAGVHFTYDLAMYQPDIAYAAVDAGADAVVGTHPHNLQAIDVYEGKPIFYSLGNIVFDQPENHAAQSVTKGYLQYYGMDPKSGAENYPHPRHTRDSVLVHLELEGSRSSFEAQPVRIDGDANPVPVASSNEEAGRIVRLLKTLSSEIGIELEYTNNVLTVSDPGEVDSREWIRNRNRSYPWLDLLRLTEYSNHPLSLDEVLKRGAGSDLPSTDC